MTNEFHTEYQYDRCTSRGICSINPTTSSLQEVILLYLRHAAYYGLQFEKKGIKNKIIRNLILNTLSILSSNYEISERNFEIINSAFQKELPVILKEYKESFDNKQLLETEKLLNSAKTINEYIRFGEKEFNKRIRNMEAKDRNLYRILFILTKSLCVNILTYESFGQDAEEEILSAFVVLDLLNSVQKNRENIKEFISNIAKKDCELMKNIRLIQEKEYGKQEECEVSFSTQKSKAVLVVGTNLKELEKILDEFQEKDIDIYTHDNMILAHTFPKLRKYKNLKGQFGQGMENCLLDFSTFPGPIILTRNSLFNIENLYRGRLFTTDFAYSKGVIPIKNNDFSGVIISAEESKGFKTGKTCPKEKIGFSLESALNTINKKLENKNFEQIILIGIDGYSIEEKEYFKTLLQRIPQNILIISLSCCQSKDNIICLNASFDNTSMIRLTEEITKITKKKMTLFFPYSDRHTLSSILYLSRINTNKTFVGKWNQTIINPNIMKGLKEDFNILELSTPKNDLDCITNS